MEIVSALQETMSASKAEERLMVEVRAE